MSGRATILTGLLLALVLGIGAVAWQGPSVTTLATYATSLDGRSRSQRHNALLALQRLDGAVIAPGATFSFNDQVGSWSRDQGYVKAPVSFSGQLIPSWGGGVCQTSTTLYNVALLAGCDITERHRHHFAPTYCPPGRDAAVAYDAIDLAFRNPYPWPLTLHTESRHDRIVISMTGRHGAPPVQLETQVYELRRPATLSVGGEGPTRLANPGKTGVSVATWRIHWDGHAESRELLSEDDYPSMDRVYARIGE